MPTASIIVVAVADEGDTVIVHGLPEDGGETGTPVAFAFHAKGEGGSIERAAAASRLARGSTVVIEYEPVAEGWNLARRLSAP
jgi:hypothetical protein